jgi:hypothetical protein
MKRRKCTSNEDSSRILSTGVTEEYITYVKVTIIHDELHIICSA